MNAAAVCECLSGSVKISLIARDLQSRAELQITPDRGEVRIKLDFATSPQHASDHPAY